MSEPIHQANRIFCAGRPVPPTLVSMCVRLDVGNLAVAQLGKDFIVLEQPASFHAQIAEFSMWFDGDDNHFVMWVCQARNETKVPIFRHEPGYNSP